MKNKKIWLVIVLLFGMMIGGYAQSGGTFTLTDIPVRFDGMYAALFGIGEYNHLLGQEGLNRGSRISDGRVVLPMWIIRGDRIERYSGNHFAEVVIDIYDSASILSSPIYTIYFSQVYVITHEVLVILGNNSVSFSNGSATRSWRDANR